MPPASGGTCGAHSPASRAGPRSSSRSAIARVVLAPDRGLVRVHVLLHERAVAGTRLEVLRREEGLGHRSRILQMRLGLQLGYDDPGVLGRPRGGGGAMRLRLGVDVGGLRLGRRLAPRLDRWAHRRRSSSGTAIMQMPARTPATTAATVATLDLLSGDRVLLGLGTSGPQVAEGWHGQAVGQAAHAHARVPRDRAHDPPPRGAARAPRRALRHPLLAAPTRPGSASRSS